MEAFDSEDLAKDVYQLDPEDDPPIQRSLGINWNLTDDNFHFSMSTDDKPLSRRGVLSAVNSLYDPHGFLAPVTIGRHILRQIVSDTSNLDYLLTEPLKSQWNYWKSSLQAWRTSTYHVLLRIHQISTSPWRRNYWLFVMPQLRQSQLYHTWGQPMRMDQQVGFVLGKSKLAPTSGHTIQRFELFIMCSCFSGWNSSNSSRPYWHWVSCSEIFLGQPCCFRLYPQRHKAFLCLCLQYSGEKKRNLSLPKQWSYIPISLNPADVGTRMLSPKDLQKCAWLNGPSSFLAKIPHTNTHKWWDICACGASRWQGIP